MSTTIIPRPAKRSNEASTAIAEVTRRSLINSDSCQYMNRVRYKPRAIRDRWLENLARNVISLVRELPPTRERDWLIIDRLRAQGYERFEDADIVVLLTRLMRAGYLSREEIG